MARYSSYALRNERCQFRQIEGVNANLRRHQLVQQGAEEVFEKTPLRLQHFKLLLNRIQHANNFYAFLLAW